MNIVDTLFLAIYTAEVIIKITFQRVEFFSSGWNLLGKCFSLIYEGRPGERTNGG